jgi:hypothetical protein
MNKLVALLLICLPFLSFAEERTPEFFAKEIVAGIENAMTEESDGRFALICFVKGSVEIIQTVKPVSDWDEEYREEMKAKIVLAISRGGNLFQLLQIKEKEKVLI